MDGLEYATNDRYYIEILTTKQYVYIFLEYNKYNIVLYIENVLFDYCLKMHHNDSCNIDVF